MSVLLQYPYTTPTLSLTLRNPILGNPETLQVKTTFNISMSGVFRSTKRTPGSYSLTYTFDSVSVVDTPSACIKDQLTEILDFIKTALGSWVKLTDWNNQIWKVKILTTPAEFTSRSKEFSEFVLTLEGFKV